jgi:hypothetical protein
MKFITTILLLLLSATFTISERAVCNYCDESCVRVKMTDTLKILRRLEKRDELDTYVNEEETCSNFDIDIAVGNSTVYRAEATNLLSAEIVTVHIELNEDKTKMHMTGRMIIPELYTKSRARSIFKTRNTDKMKGLNGLTIPPVIDTIGTMKGLFRNTPMDFVIDYNIVPKANNKINLDAQTLHGTMSCENADDSEYDYQPDPNSGDAMTRKLLFSN